MDHHHHHHHVPVLTTQTYNISTMNMSHMHSTPMPKMDDMKNMNMNHMGHNMDHGMHDSNDTCGGGMMMYFHTGNCEYILFEKLYTTTTGHIVAASIVMFFLAILYEGLKYGREVLIQKTAAQTKYINTTLPGTSQENIIVQSPQTVASQMLSCGHFVQTLLHMLQVFISYCLMLVFMTYNAWLCIAIVLGAGAGYFLFGWRRAVIVDVNEHCH